MNELLKRSLEEVKQKDPNLLVFTLSTPVEMDRSIPTACTNGVRIRWNPDYFKDKNFRYGAFVLAHEYLHAALRHPQRLKKWMNKEKFNIAADHVVNLILKAFGWEVPPNLYCDPKYTGWSVEAVYADIMREDAQEPPPPPPPMMGNPMGAQPEPDEESEEDGDGEEEDKESDDADEGGGEGEEEGDEEGEGKGKGEKEGEGDDADADGEGKGDGEDEGEGDTDGEGEGDGDADEEGDGKGGGKGEGEGEGETGGESPPADPFAKPVFSDCPGEFEEPPEDETAQQAGERAVMQVVMDESLQSMARGCGAAAYLAKVNGDPEPDVPWQAVVQKYLNELAKSRLTYNPGHSQYQGGEIVMPRISGRQLGTVGIVRDSSGSVDAKSYAVYIREMMSLLDLYEITRLIVIDNDAVVQQVSDSMAGDPPLNLRYGHGGTHFKPAFDWFEENAVTPSLMIFFTDSYGIYPSDPPPYPVLWMVSGKGQFQQPGDQYYPPFGEMIGLHL